MEIRGEPCRTIAGENDKYTDFVTQTLPPGRWSVGEKVGGVKIIYRVEESVGELGR